MLKRSLATVTCSAVLALVFAPAAHAQDPDLESYGAGASATALVLSLLEEELTFSSTGAAVGSTPEAAANGQALTTPLFSSDPSEVSSEGAPVTGESCVLEVDLPAPINFAGPDSGVSCVDTSAAVTDGSPLGSSESAEVTLDIISAELVATVTDTLLRPLLTEVLAGLETVLTSLDALLVADLDLDLLIDRLLETLTTGETLASVGVGETSSTATDVEGLATVTGVEIVLLPGLLLPGAAPLPLATVTVGDSFSSAAYDPASGEIATDGQAAFLDVDLTGLEIVLNGLVGGIGDALTGGETPIIPDPLAEIVSGLLADLLELAGDLDDEVEGVVNVTVDQLACPDSPLAAVLCFEAGTVNELDAAGLESYGFDAFGEGTEGIESTILGLSVLDGTLELGIGQTAAAANAVPADDTALPGDPPTSAPPRGTLPTTGADDMLPVTLALFAAAVAGITLIRRTRSV
jgi:hypothetical protein